MADTEPRKKHSHSVAIIILNYRTPAMTLECLESLSAEAERLRAKVIVVDNGSGDDSPAMLRKGIAERGWESWATVLEVHDNRGFSAGNNAGISSVDADYYFLLNSDTLVRPGAIGTLRQAAEEYPDASMWAPRLEFKDGSPQVSCFRFQSPVSELIRGAKTGILSRLFRKHHIPHEPSGKTMTCSWASFAAIFIPHETIARVGGMDDGYFMYYEDMDYCRTAGQDGSTVRYIPAAKVAHLRGGTSPVKALSAERRKQPDYFYKSRARYFTKFYGRPGLVLANILFTAGASLAYLRHWITGKEIHICREELKDIWVRP